MATRALTIGVPALTSPAAANDTTAPDWTAHPLARRLLASFATTPPPVDTLDRYQRWDVSDAVYTGFRVDCLRVIRASVLTPAFLAAEAAGNTTLARQIVHSITVDNAVKGAVRIRPLHVITTTVRQIDPAVWGAAL
jgi:hypothetical protein